MFGQFFSPSLSLSGCCMNATFTVRRQGQRNVRQILTSILYLHCGFPQWTCIIDYKDI